MSQTTEKSWIRTTFPIIPSANSKTMPLQRSIQQRNQCNGQSQNYLIPAQ